MYIYSLLYNAILKVSSNNISNPLDMRTSEFISSKNISLIRLNNICEYLFLPSLKINSKISEERKKLLEMTLKNELFDEWYKIKSKVELIEINNAKRLIKQLEEIENFEEISAELCERIINSHLFLIKKSTYPTIDAEQILQIIYSENHLLEKISLLKKNRPHREMTKSNEKISSQNIEIEYESSYDPYENFYWGGLSGEEAYVGYCNTE